MDSAAPWHDREGPTVSVWAVASLPYCHGHLVVLVQARPSEKLRENDVRKSEDGDPARCLRVEAVHLVEERSSELRVRDALDPSAIDVPVARLADVSQPSAPGLEKAVGEEERERDRKARGDRGMRSE